MGLQSCVPCTCAHVQILNAVDPFFTIADEILFDVSNSRLMDGWIMDPIATGAVAALGGFANLGPLIQADSSMQFNELNRFYREVSGVYAKQVRVRECTQRGGNGAREEHACIWGTATGVSTLASHVCGTHRCSVGSSARRWLVSRWTATSF